MQQGKFGNAYNIQFKNLGPKENQNLSDYQILC